MEEDKYGHYQYFEIFRTSYKERNQDGNICDEGEGPHKTTQSVKDCIERFIDCELKCHIPWHTSERKEEHADCSSEEEFERYVFLSNRLSSLDSQDMEHATGCMRRCDRMEYKLWETTPLGMKAKYKPEWLTLSFIFSSGDWVNLIDVYEYYIFLLRHPKAQPPPLCLLSTCSTY